MKTLKVMIVYKMNTMPVKKRKNIFTSYTRIKKRKEKKKIVSENEEPSTH